MKCFLILIFFCNIFVSKGQNKFQLQEDFSWEEVENWNPQLIEKFIQLTPNEFEYYRMNEPYYPNLDSLKKALHVVDINGDKKEDIVFDGQTLGEPREISIFINQGKTFKKVFSDRQGILKMEFKDGSLSRLHLLDWGCCADYRSFVKFYDVKLEKGELKFKFQAKFQYIQNTNLPQLYCDTLKQIKVLNNMYNLRSMPWVDDTSSYGYEGQEVKGNVLGKLPKDAKALVLAKEFDATNRLWYFVAVLPKCDLTQTVFFEDPKEIKSYKCGWISSRFVVELK